MIVRNKSESYIDAYCQARGYTSPRRNVPLSKSLFLPMAWPASRVGVLNLNGLTAAQLARFMNAAAMRGWLLIVQSDTTGDAVWDWLDWTFKVRKNERVPLPWASG